MVTGREEGVYAVGVEGVGKASAVSATGDDSALYLLTTDYPAWLQAIDSDGLVKDWWEHSGDEDKPFTVPALTLRMDYRKGTFRVEGTTFRFVSVTGDSDLDLRQVFLYPVDPPPIGTLVGPSDVVLSSGTQININDLDGNAITNLDGVEIGIKRERIVLGTHTSGGNYTGCKRAVHATPATAHRRNTDADVEVFTHQSAIERRRVFLWWIPSTATDIYDDRELLWSGVLDDTGYTKVTNCHLECQGLTSLLGHSKLYADPWVGEVRYVAGRDRVGPSGTRQVLFSNHAPPGLDTIPTPRTRQPTASEATGDKILVQIKESVYYARLDWLDGERIYRIVDLDAPLFDTPAISDGDVRVGDLVREVIWAHPDAPAVLQPDGISQRTWGGDDGSFVTALKQVLISTIHGSNDTEDLALDLLGLPLNAIDEDSFDKARHDLGELGQMDRVFMGGVGESEAPTVADWAEQHMAALGIGFTVTDNGKLGLEVFHDLPDYEGADEEVAITDPDILEDELVTASSGIRDTIGTVAAVYRRTPSGKTTALNVNDILRRSRVIGARNKDSLDLGGYGDVNKALQAAERYLQRWARRTAVVKFGIPFGTRIRPGITCKLTSDQVLGVDANDTVQVGVTNARVVIQEERIDPERHRRVYTGRITALGLKGGWIPPFAEVASGSGDTYTIQANSAQPSTGGVVTRDSDQFVAGDVLDLVDQYGTSRGTGYVLLSVSTNTLVFTATVSPTPAAGDFFVMATYDDQSTTQQSQWITIADTGGKLGTGNADGFQYTG